MALLGRYLMSEQDTQDSSGNELEAILNKRRQSLEQDERKDILGTFFGKADCTKTEDFQLEEESEDEREKKALIMQLENAENENERLKALLDDVERKHVQNDPIQISTSEAAKKAKEKTDQKKVNDEEDKLKSKSIFYLKEEPTFEQNHEEEEALKKKSLEAELDLERQIPEQLEKKSLMMKLVDVQIEVERVKSLLQDVEKKLVQIGLSQSTKAEDAERKSIDQERLLLEKKILIPKLQNAIIEEARLKSLLQEVNKNLIQIDLDQKTKAKDEAKRSIIRIRPKCLIPVDKNGFEFEEVSRKFLSGIGEYRDKANVLKIWKNEEMERRDMYFRLKEKIKKELKTSDYDLVEKQLWHGSTEHAIYSIVMRGFNRSFAGANASFFGDGCYFAVSPSYCIERGFSHPETKDVYHIVLAKVLTGKSCQGEQGQKVLPLGFHSAVDNLQSPNMYIVHDDYAAYPDYIISFKIKL